MKHPVSPLAPKSYPDLPRVSGVRFATAEAGIKYQNRTDVLLAVFEPGTTVAGVLTKSKCPSAPVDWCRTHLPSGAARALVVNSGNANAFTGMRGHDAVHTTANLAAHAVGCVAQDVFLSSTGVIGEPLDARKFEDVFEDCVTRLHHLPWRAAAEAIMTTDTYPKLAGREVEIDGTNVVINGIAKGSGMIAPDMATMLAYVFTDMPVAAPVLQAVLGDKVQQSFNAITVDSDTSTSDTLLMFATGTAARHGVTPLTSIEDPRFAAFADAVGEVLFDLAMQVVRDGEGATKFVTVAVTGATSDESANTIARAIANSPLVKTAVAGEDANWGRIVMAVGKAGEPAERDRLEIKFGAFTVASKGERVTGYDEDAVSAYMKSDSITIEADLGLGTGRAMVYTCDLTHGYVDINGSYRS